jgi:hypothetical protein
VGNEGREREREETIKREGERERLGELRREKRDRKETYNNDFRLIINVHFHANFSTLSQ